MSPHRSDQTGVPVVAQRPERPTPNDRPCGRRGDIAEASAPRECSGSCYEQEVLLRRSDAPAEESSGAVAGCFAGRFLYETFAERHRALLDEQDAGICVFFVLVDRNGSIVGRFNLYDLETGAAEVGYRVAERVAGQGVATEVLSSLCRKAADDHGLRTLTAGTSTANMASQRVLEKAGFVSAGSCVVGGEPCLKFKLSLADMPSAARVSGTTNHQASDVRREA